MAIRLVDQYPNRANPATPDYPHGSVRNESSPGANDGTPLEQAWGNDIEGFKQALLAEGGVDPSGLPDRVGASDQLDALKAVIRKHAAAPLTSRMTVTVGAGGEFSTINDALASLTRRYPTYVRADNDQPSLAVIRLLSGFVMSEQVLVEGVDLSWIRIEADDAEVSISRAALTEELFTYYPAFGAINGGTLPVIACLFKMDSTGDANRRDGVFVTDKSSVIVEPGCGVTHAGERGLHISNDSHGHARGANFSFAGTFGARIANGSSANIRNAILTDAGESGIATSSNSKVCADYVDVSRAAASGLFVQSAIVSFRSGIADDCHSGAGVGYTGSIEVMQGGIVYAAGASVKNAGKNSVTVRESTFVGYDGVPVRAIDLSGATDNAVEAHNATVIIGGAIGGEGANLQNSGVFALDAYGSRVVMDNSNAAGSMHGLRARFGSHVSARNFMCPGASAAATVSEGSYANLTLADLSGATDTALDVNEGSRATCTSANLSGALNFGIRARGGSDVSAKNCNARRGAEDSSQDFSVEEGSTIRAHGGVGGTSVDPNTVSAAGIIFK